MPFIGLSATPWARGLGRLYQELIVAATTQDLIDLGYLSKFRVCTGTSRPEGSAHSCRRLPRGRPRHGDGQGAAGGRHRFNLARSLGKVVRRCASPSIGFTPSTYARSLRKPVLALVMSIDSRRLPSGSRCAEVRQRRLPDRCQCRRAHHGRGLGCAVHHPRSPDESEMLFVQIIGSGLRPADEKDYCLILDHSDTTSRLGFVTDIHHDELDDGERRHVVARDRLKLPKECPMCACLRPPTTNVCPNCGFEAKPVNKIRIVDGELRELDRNKHSIVNPAEVYGQLKWIATIAATYRAGPTIGPRSISAASSLSASSSAAVRAVTGDSALGEIATHRLRQGAGSITVVQKPHKGRTGIGRLKTGRLLPYNSHRGLSCHRQPPVAKTRSTTLDIENPSVPQAPALRPQSVGCGCPQACPLLWRGRRRAGQQRSTAYDHGNEPEEQG